MGDDAPRSILGATRVSKGARRNRDYTEMSLSDLKIQPSTGISEMDSVAETVAEQVEAEEVDKLRENAGDPVATESTVTDAAWECLNHLDRAGYIRNDYGEVVLVCSADTDVSINGTTVLASPAVDADEIIGVHTAALRPHPVYADKVLVIEPAGVVRARIEPYETSHGYVDLGAYESESDDDETANFFKQSVEEIAESLNEDMKAETPLLPAEEAPDDFPWMTEYDDVYAVYEHRVNGDDRLKFVFDSDDLSAFFEYADRLIESDAGLAPPNCHAAKPYDEFLEAGDWWVTKTHGVSISHRLFPDRDTDDDSPFDLAQADATRWRAIIDDRIRQFHQRADKARSRGNPERQRAFRQAAESLEVVR